MELVAEPTAGPSGSVSPPAARQAPPPLRGGPLALLRFMRANHMLSRDYAILLARWALLKLRHGRRLQTDGICFICPGVKLEIGRGAKLASAAGRGSGMRARSACTRARSASEPRP